MKLLLLLASICISCCLTTSQVANESENANAQIGGNGGANINGIPQLGQLSMNDQSLTALLSEIDPLINTILNQLQQYKNVPESTGQNRQVLSLLLQVRALLQNQLQSLSGSLQTSSVIAMKLQISALLANVNIAINLAVAQTSGPLEIISVPIRSVLSLFGIGQINSAPLILGQISRLLSSNQQTNLKK